MSDETEISVDDVSATKIVRLADRRSGTSGRADDANIPALPIIDGMTEHLFEYTKAREQSIGSRWGISIWAEDEADARDRLRRAAEGEFIGVLYAKVPFLGEEGSHG